MKRLLSHSEVSAALDCQARHAFAYTGVLTDGTTLKPKSTAPRLREGRAWGAAVAAWHQQAGSTLGSVLARAALHQSLEEDAASQQQAGVYDATAWQQMATHLRALLDDYTAHADPIPVDRPEHELYVAIPSRGGRRASSVYALKCYIDALHTDSEGRVWIVEFKLRDRLRPLQLIEKDRQLRWYAWAWRRATGDPVTGIIYDERLNAEPAAVRLNQNGSVSKVQSCRPDEYIAAGGEDTDVLHALEAKAWGQRHRFILTPRELDEAGWQLTSAARQIHQLDTGLVYPIRNPSPARCPGCQYRDICIDPADEALVNALYDRTPPKRDRQEEPRAA